MVYKLRVTDLSSFPLVEAITFGFKTNEDGDLLREYDDGYVDPTINIETLEELQSFIEKYHKVVVTKTDIEIYNGWRE